MFDHPGGSCLLFFSQEATNIWLWVMAPGYLGGPTYLEGFSLHGAPIVGDRGVPIIDEEGLPGFDPS